MNAVFFYVSNLIIFLAVSIFTIYSYYKWWLHMEANLNYTSYFIIVLLLYFFYKWLKIVLSDNKKISFSPLWIVGYALLHIFILCIFYFSLKENNTWWWGTGDGVVLFFKIIGYLVLPTLITFTNYTFWYKLLSHLKTFTSETSWFKFLMSLWTGFVAFFLLITISAIFGFYNEYAVFWIIILFVIFSVKQIVKTLENLVFYKINFDNHDVESWDFFKLINLNLITAELSFIVLTFLIWVNFINIIRPMPIWWDDLGVYMNFPKMLAVEWWLLKGSWLIAWQLLTWIGFIFKSATQAFFINQIGWILSIIVVTVSISDLLKTNKKTFLAIPIILATMLYAMPMVIFQQAKDMKLDPWLFFISALSIYWIYSLFSRFIWNTDDNSLEDKSEKFINSNKNKESVFLNAIFSTFKRHSHDLFNKNDYLIYLFIIWSLAWLAFAIKLTTLMLILWVFAVIFYANLGFVWFLGYFFLFIWVFTRFKLWDFMNISYPKDNINLVNQFAYVSIFVSFVLLAFSVIKNKKESINKVVILCLVFGAWVLISILPWFAKNIQEAKGEITVTNIIWWKFDINNYDHTKIYSKEDLKKIESSLVSGSINEDWKTKNEDLGRYFGYEDGINNYLKLPWNLTLQSNQAWEYTEITYFFLLFIPVIFLFLNFQSPVSRLVIFGIIIFEWLYFLPFSPVASILTWFFSKQLLPWGYLLIWWVPIIWIAYFVYTLKSDKLSQIFKLNIVFWVFYTLLFVVAAFWIVWYWIAMYYSFLLMIGISLYYLSIDDTEIKEDDSSGITQKSLNFVWSLSVFVVIFVYFWMSSIPHWLNNINPNTTWFTEFKAWKQTQEEWIFASHPDYFAILAELNIKDKDKFTKDIVSNIQDEALKTIITKTLWDKINIQTLESILKEIINLNPQQATAIWLDELTRISVATSSRDILNSLYNQILYPPKDNRNTDKIYRIGTFLTYFISQNRERYYDDSLVFNFDKYFYNKDPNVTIERMKKMWIKYFLVDLNAATIDRDPRHDLTRRFESLLQTFKSDKLELVQTDSICLKVALEEKASNYMTIAWVNYESYPASGWTINRWQKQLDCYNHILTLFNEWKITDKNYTYLKPLLDYVRNNKVESNKLLPIFQQYINHWWLVLFRIK